jgi:hypothetical protein
VKGAGIGLILSTVPKECAGGNDLYVSWRTAHFVVSALLLAIVCPSSLFLSLKAIWQSIALYRKFVRRERIYGAAQRQHPPLAEEQPSAQEPSNEQPSSSTPPPAAVAQEEFPATPQQAHLLFSKFFLRWRDYGAILTSVLTVAYCVLDIRANAFGVQQRNINIILGTASLMAYVQLMYYFKYFPSYHVRWGGVHRRTLSRSPPPPSSPSTSSHPHPPKALTKATRRALPAILRLLTGVLPLYLGYCLLGMMWFGLYTAEFETFDRTTTTLFGVFNGDSIVATFQTIYSTDPFFNFFTRMFMYSFIVFFIYSVLQVRQGGGGAVDRAWVCMQRQV